MIPFAPMSYRIPRLPVNSSKLCFPNQIDLIWPLMTVRSTLLAGIIVSNSVTFFFCTPYNNKVLLFYPLSSENNRVLSIIPFSSSPKCLCLQQYSGAEVPPIVMFKSCDQHSLWVDPTLLLLRSPPPKPHRIPYPMLNNNLAYLCRKDWIRLTTNARPK